MRRWLVLLFVLMVFFTCYEISSSFGLFESNQNIVVNSDIGKWEITVNDTAVNSSTTFDVTNVSVSGEENVEENLFAPGTSGYFDVVINPNDTDVSIRYDLTYRDDMIQNRNIYISNVEVVEGEDVIQTGEKTYAGVISLQDILDDEQVVIRFYIVWRNEDTNNDVDSLYGSNSMQFEIPITINFIQYTGEEIIEYNNG